MISGNRPAFESAHSAPGSEANRNPDGSIIKRSLLQDSHFAHSNLCTKPTDAKKRTLPIAIDTKPPRIPSQRGLNCQAHCEAIPIEYPTAEHEGRVRK